MDADEEGLVGAPACDKRLRNPEHDIEHCGDVRVGRSVSDLAVRMSLAIEQGHCRTLASLTRLSK